MDAQTIAIIGVGATLIAVFMPPLIMLIRRVDNLSNQVSRLTQVVTAWPTIDTMRMARRRSQYLRISG